MTVQASGEIVRRNEAVSAIVRAITSPAQMQQFAAALAGTGIPPERFVRQAMSLLRNNPKLGDCVEGSFLGAMMEAAQTGVDLSPSLAEAHVIPYAARRGDQQVATLVYGYRGLVKLVRRGEVTSIRAEVVRAKDKFRMRLGDSPRLWHEPDPLATEAERGPLVGAYAVAGNARGGTDWVFLPSYKIEMVRAGAPGSKRDDSPWNTHPEEMWCKTALRRLCSKLPKNERAAIAVDREDRIERGAPLTDEPPEEALADPDTPKTVAELAKKLTGTDLPDPASEEGRRLSRELDQKAAGQ